MEAQCHVWKQRDLLCRRKKSEYCFLLIENENYLGLILKFSTLYYSQPNRPPFFASSPFSSQGKQSCKIDEDCLPLLPAFSFCAHFLLWDCFQTHKKPSFLKFSVLFHLPKQLSALGVNLIHTEIEVSDGLKVLLLQWYFISVWSKAGVCTPFCKGQMKKCFLALLPKDSWCAAFH